MSAPASTMTSYARSSGQPRRLVLDPWVIGPVAALLLIGLVMVASASIGISEKETGHAFYYFQRQLIYVGAGLVAAAIGLAVPTRVWEEKSIYLLVLGFALLVLVLVPGIGYQVNGARRWIRLGFMNFQVSELARVLLLTYVASYAVRRADDLRNDFVGFLKPVAVLVLAAALLLLEPDFGAATVLFATGIAVLFLAGARITHLLVPVVFGTLGLAALAVLSPYRLRRLTGFLDPWGDPFNSGFQLVQSLIAIGRGEWLGVGLGASVQKLFYLPEAHTDFVFAVLAEEFGFAGVAIVVALFALLVGRALQISRNAAAAGQTFQSYVAAAIGIWLGLQAFVNIGVNMGLLPTKGLTLPLLSYGGSSMLITLGWLGVLLRIHHDTQATGRAATTSSREPRRP
jgi:cell division protein FtsW